jgi:hypothetical protein
MASNQLGQNEQHENSGNNVKRNSVGRPRKNPNSHNVQRRYNLALNNADFDEVKTISEEKGVSFLQIVQSFVRFGIHVYHETKNDGAQIILRKRAKDGKEAEDTQILIL